VRTQADFRVTTASPLSNRQLNQPPHERAVGSKSLVCPFASTGKRTTQLQLDTNTQARREKRALWCVLLFCGGQKYTRKKKIINRGRRSFSWRPGWTCFEACW